MSVSARAMEDEALPAGSRRREVGTASARSLLLTVLGEFVHPRGTPGLDRNARRGAGRARRRREVRSPGDRPLRRRRGVGIGEVGPPRELAHHPARYQAARRRYKAHLQFHERNPTLGRQLACPVGRHSRNPASASAQAADAAHLAGDGFTQPRHLDPARRQQGRRRGSGDRRTRPQPTGFRVDGETRVDRRAGCPHLRRLVTRRRRATL